ncbi:hypothetical protein [Cupriavidus sp. RAF12]|uniref:hypothetical protein n=1 Tax=Cupriavidus sp. RAF12 TaxID=3233050 RepID=UPI003F92CE5D
MSQFTAQSLFDTIATHLLTQGKKALTYDGTVCRYRGTAGTSCAVGCVIPNKFYTEDIEGESVTSMLKHAMASTYSAPLNAFLLNDLGPHRDLLRDLQYLHDEHAVESWEFELQSMARRLNLNLPEVLQ